MTLSSGRTVITAQNSFRKGKGKAVGTYFCGFLAYTAIIAAVAVDSGDENFYTGSSGEVAERLNAPVLKTGKGASPSWVRIPPSPPSTLTKSDQTLSFLSVYNAVT